jgi:aquaporin Z
MKYLNEFIGTFFLVLTIGMTVLHPNGIGNMAPLAIGCILATLVFAGGHISGAHYNPAVSLAVFLCDKFNAKDLILYWIAQLAAAVAAAYVTKYFKGAAAEVSFTPDILKALLAELLFTFALCYVVLNVAVAKETQGNSYFGFAIGFTVLAGAYAVGTVSSGAFNPAVALGITLLNLSLWSNLWIFIVSNFLGAALAAMFFKASHSKQLPF